MSSRLYTHYFAVAGPAAKPGTYRLYAVYIESETAQVPTAEHRAQAISVCHDWRTRYVIATQPDDDGNGWRWDASADYNGQAPTILDRECRDSQAAIAALDKAADDYWIAVVHAYTLVTHKGASILDDRHEYLPGELGLSADV